MDRPSPALEPGLPRGAAPDGARLVVAALATLAALAQTACVEGLENAAAGCDEAGCAPGESCVDGACKLCLTCPPGTCAAVDDGCGQVLTCDCATTDECRDGLCVCAEGTAEEGCVGRCGGITLCGVDVACGPCAEGLCHEETGRCILPRRPFCWSSVVPWNTLQAVLRDDPTIEHEQTRGGSVVLEGEAQALYLTALTVPPELAERPHRLALGADGLLPDGLLERLPGTDVPQGDTEAPFLRADGTELFFVAVDSAGGHLYELHRSGVWESWSAAQPVGVELSCHGAALLADERTLLCTGSVPGTLQAYRRPTTTPGDLAFVVAEAVALEPAGLELSTLALGCDGAAILVGSGASPPTALLAAELLSTEPVELGPAEPVAGLDPLGPFHSATEGPGCGLLYVAAAAQRLGYATRVPCP